jgi:hypothetical protein
MEKNNVRPPYTDKRKRKQAHIINEKNVLLTIISSE